MRVYVLHFEDLSRLTHAFDVVLQDEYVESCMIERDALRLRFLAPQKNADAIVAELYQHGGLAWCTRHDFEEPAA